jgi:hypothetical protein
MAKLNTITHRCRFVFGRVIQLRFPLNYLVGVCLAYYQTRWDITILSIKSYFSPTLEFHDLDTKNKLLACSVLLDRI